MSVFHAALRRADSALRHRMTTLHQPSFQVLCLLALCVRTAQAQHPKGSLLVVDIENQTVYERDTSDPKLLATNPNATPATSARNFNQLINIGDIVAINGTPVKGTLIEIGGASCRGEERSVVW